MFARFLESRSLEVNDVSSLGVVAACSFLAVAVAFLLRELGTAVVPGASMQARRVEACGLAVCRTEELGQHLVIGQGRCVNAGAVVFHDEALLQHHGPDDDEAVFQMCVQALTDPWAQNRLWDLSVALKNIQQIELHIAGRVQRERPDLMSNVCPGRSLASLVATISNHAQQTLIHSQPGGRGVFMVASLMQHSCSPTCTFATNGKHQYVVAHRDLNEGDEVSISYLDGRKLLADTTSRRRDLLCMYQFLCRCPRCTGKGQLDEARSCWCPSCRTGRVCPSGLGLPNFDEWNCGACGYRCTAADVAIFQRAEEQVHHIGVLHPSHYLIHRQLVKRLHRQREMRRGGQTISERQAFSMVMTAKTCLDSMELILPRFHPGKIAILEDAGNSLLLLHQITQQVGALQQAEGAFRRAAKVSSTAWAGQQPQETQRFNDLARGVRNRLSPRLPTEFT